MGGEGGKGSGGTSWDSLSGDAYVAADDPTQIKYGKLVQTILSTVLLGLAGLAIAGMEAIVKFQTGLIDGAGSFLENAFETYLGEGAALVVAGWEAALIQAVQFGPIAPLLLVGEAVVVLLIFYAMWEVNPYI